MKCFSHVVAAASAQPFDFPYCLCYETFNRNYIFSWLFGCENCTTKYTFIILLNNDFFTTVVFSSDKIKVDFVFLIG